MDENVINTLKIISQAKKVIYDPYYDPHLANYMLRDLQITKDSELSDLSWSMHKNECNSNDVEYLIEQLEKYILNKYGVKGNIV